MGDIALRGKGRAFKDCAGRDPECKFSLKVVEKYAKGGLIKGRPRVAIRGWK